MIRGMKGVRSMLLNCRREARPATEFTHTNIAPHAAASFSVPKPKMIIRGIR
jgi:hypothetical protein